MINDIYSRSYSHTRKSRQTQKTEERRDGGKKRELAHIGTEPTKRHQNKKEETA